MHGLVRVKIVQWLTTEPYFRARVEVITETVARGTETEALMMNARNLARRVIQLSPNIPEEAAIVLDDIHQAGPLADFLVSNLQLDIPTRQKFLVQTEITQRLRQVGVELQRQL